MGADVSSSGVPLPTEDKLRGGVGEAQACQDGRGGEERIWVLLIQSSGRVFLFLFFFPGRMRRVFLLRTAANFACQLLLLTLRMLLDYPKSTSCD